MTGFHRKVFPLRVKKTKAELRRELEVEKAAFAANGGKSRSFYERRACPDAFRPKDPPAFQRWKPKFKNTKSARRNKKARQRAARAARRGTGNGAYNAQKKKPIPQPDLQKKIPREVLQRYAAKLNENIPASEKWFLALYKEHRLLRDSDRFNEPFADVCIPDIVNHEYGYIIEVQDPTHKKVDRIVRDAKKNVLFAKSGYRAFYVWAWDHLSFDAFLPVFKEFTRERYFQLRILKDLESF